MNRLDQYFWILIIAALGLLAMVAKADEYCDYTKQKAEAERIFNQVPQLFAGFGTNSSANTNTVGIGVTESLSKYLKGRLSGVVGQDDCNVYLVTNEIQKHVTYDLVVLQLRYTQNREELMQTGITRLTDLLKSEQPRVATGASTIINVLTLQAAIAKLEDTLANLEQQKALVHLPDMDLSPLNDLLAKVDRLNRKEQRDVAKQSKYDNWDLVLTTGVGSNPTAPMFSQIPSKGFANLQFTYSFGAPARNRALDRAAESYADWLSTNDNGPIQLGVAMKDQVTRAATAAIASEAAYNHYREVLGANLAAIEGLDTAPAHGFRIQLVIEQVTNDIERESNDFNIEAYTLYLTQNFQ